MPRTSKNSGNAPPDNFTTSSLRKRRKGQRPTAAERRIIQDRFLEAFASSANMLAACKSAGVDRNTIRAWQEHDETFGFQFKQAEADANDVIRAAIFTRAVQGVDKPLHYQGRLVKDERGKPATVKDYSDTLLIFLAKSRMPEFRDKQQVEVSGTLDVNTLASEADAKFSAWLAASTTSPILAKPDASAEG